MKETDTGYNVIVLVFDTLRPDFLSCYSDSAIETEHFDSVAENGVMFENAFAVGPGTPISHGGIFTGQYPSNSGITGQYINLPQNNPTIAEWFQQHGYSTAGIAGPSKISSDFGYDRGFDDYFEPYYDIGYKDHKPTVDYIKNILTDVEIFKDAYRTAINGEGKFTRFKFDRLARKARRADEPFFGFANLLEAHTPYYPPHGYREQFDPEFTEPLHFVLELLFDRQGTHGNDDVDIEKIKGLQTGDGIGRFLADPEFANGTELEIMKRWYNASIKYLDEELGRFLKYYRTHLSEDTYLVITADHGEQFGEHGLIGHSHYLFDETVQIPLFINGPELPSGTAVEDLASLTDLYPTLSNLAGIDVPEFTDGSCLFEGSLRDHVVMEHGERDISDFETTAHGRHLSEEQLSQFAAGRKAIRTTEHKLVVDSRGERTLYDVTTTPETSIQDEARAEQLHTELQDQLSMEYGQWPEGDPSDFDLNRDVVDNLESLGYI